MKNIASLIPYGAWYMSVEMLDISSEVVIVHKAWVYDFT